MNKHPICNYCTKYLNMPKHKRNKYAYKETMIDAWKRFYTNNLRLRSNCEGCCRINSLMHGVALISMMACLLENKRPSKEQQIFDMKINPTAWLNMLFFRPLDE